jgi:membrane dipeptidase
MSSLHDESLVIDGLQISKWGRPTFESMHAGGLTAVNCTCAVWEDFDAALGNVATFLRWFAEYDDVIRPVRTVDDIFAAKQEARVGIMLGFQNLAPIGDRPERLELFKQLGVGMMQIAYNTQNLVGAGCYEPKDPGLSGFGREVLEEMNRVGILADLSHAGSRTTADVIEHTELPVVYSHVCPAGLKPHPRNKTDEELKAVAASGGLVGITCFPSFLRAGNDATVDDYIEAIEYTLDVVGEDSVAIGTDFIQDQDLPFLEWLIRDKGHRRPVTVESMHDLGELVMPRGIETSADFPNMTVAMERRGWPEPRIRKVLGENWVRVLAEVWGRGVAPQVESAHGSARERA